MTTPLEKHSGSYNSPVCAFRDQEKYINLQTKSQRVHFHLDLWLILTDQQTLLLHFGELKHQENEGSQIALYEQQTGREREP